MSTEYESLKKALASSEVAKEIEDTEKRLKHYERTIFELKEFVDSKSRETDFELVKAQCLRLVDTLNQEAIIASQQMPGAGGGGGGGGMYDAQAKGGGW